MTPLKEAPADTFAITPRGSHYLILRHMSLHLELRVHDWEILCPECLGSLYDYGPTQSDQYFSRTSYLQCHRCGRVRPWAPTFSECILKNPEGAEEFQGAVEAWLSHELGALEATLRAEAIAAWFAREKIFHRFDKWAKTHRLNPSYPSLGSLSEGWGAVPLWGS